MYLIEPVKNIYLSKENHNRSMIKKDCVIEHKLFLKLLKGFNEKHQIQLKNRHRGSAQMICFQTIR